MKQTTSLTLGILKSLYPRADLDIAGDDFVMTCTDEETLKLVGDSALTADRIVDVVPIDVIGVGQLLTLHCHVCKYF
jgi:hypothetical protein